MTDIKSKIESAIEKKINKINKINRVGVISDSRDYKNGFQAGANFMLPVLLKAIEIKDTYIFKITGNGVGRGEKLRAFDEEELLKMLEGNK